MVDARIVTPELDRFLPVMYGQTVSPLAHVSGKALVVLSEPRSLFDDCLRAYEDIEAVPGRQGLTAWTVCMCALNSSILVLSSA